jgi:uncharacterized membrane protein YhiD involved in acid resistance
MPIDTNAPLSLWSLIINLIVGVGLAIALRWHFRMFGSTLSNREEFAQVFPFILLTTVLIITVVKSSLALSLGLVGALSIVRFRTPIKEPEELAYLFIAIAMGLGLGAGQTIVTIVAGLLILTVMALLKWGRSERRNKNLYLSIDWRGELDNHPEQYLEQLDNIIRQHTRKSDLRRYDVRDGSLDVTYYLDVATAKDLSGLAEELRGLSPNVGVTFLDQNQLPSI